jgi:hypothetical protein
MKQDLVIGVAAVDRQGAPAVFSHYGAPCTDLSAPGVDIFGLSFEDASLERFSSLYHGPRQGSSFSAAMVSGAAAVLKGALPSLTPDQIRLALEIGADPIVLSDDPSRERRAYGAGTLQVERALRVASNMVKSGQAKTAPLAVPASLEPSQGFVWVGGGRGGESRVRLLKEDGEERSFLAYDRAFRGGVRLALGDLFAEAGPEVVTGAGPGGGPQVRVFDAEGRARSQFFAFETSDRNGIFVETAQLDDGLDEIVVSGDVGSSGQVRVFDRFGRLKGSFYPFGRTARGVRAAAGNMDADPEDELLFTLASSFSSEVRMFDGNGRYVRSFQSLSGLNEEGGGVVVSVGDLEGDGSVEIVASRGVGSFPWVRVLDRFGTARETFVAYAPSFRGGIETAILDLDQNGEAEIVAIPVSTGGPHLRRFNREGSPIGGWFFEDPLVRGGWHL